MQTLKNCTQNVNCTLVFFITGRQTSVFCPTFFLPLGWLSFLSSLILSPVGRLQQAGVVCIPQVTLKEIRACFNQWLLWVG